MTRIKLVMGQFRPQKIISSSEGLSVPVASCMLKNGDIIFSNGARILIYHIGAIYHFCDSYKSEKVDGNIGDSKFDLIGGLCTSVGGEFIYASDFGHNCIYKIDLDGNASIYSGSGRAGFKNDSSSLRAEFHGPRGLCLSYSGDLLVTDYYNHQIRRVSLEGGAVTTFTGDGCNNFFLGLSDSCSLSHPQTIYRSFYGKYIAFCGSMAAIISSDGSIIDDFVPSNESTLDILPNPLMRTFTPLCVETTIEPRYTIYSFKNAYPALPTVDETFPPQQKADSASLFLNLMLNSFDLDNNDPHHIFNISTTSSKMNSDPQPSATIEACSKAPSRLPFPKSTIFYSQVTIKRYLEYCSLFISESRSNPSISLLRLIPSQNESIMYNIADLPLYPIFVLQEANWPIKEQLFFLPPEATAEEVRSYVSKSFGPKTRDYILCSAETGEEIDSAALVKEFAKPVFPDSSLVFHPSIPTINFSGINLNFNVGKKSVVVEGIFSRSKLASLVSNEFDIPLQLLSMNPLVSYFDRIWQTFRSETRLVNASFNGQVAKGSPFKLWSGLSWAKAIEKIAFIAEMGPDVALEAWLKMKNSEELVPFDTAVQFCDTDFCMLDEVVFMPRAPLMIKASAPGKQILDVYMEATQTIEDFKKFLAVTWNVSPHHLRVSYKGVFHRDATVIGAVVKEKVAFFVVIILPSQALQRC